MHDQFPVFDESYLPSANMLATLAVFFYYHRGQPNAAQAREIRKWFWATGVGKRYSGAGYNRNIVADAKLFAAIALGKNRKFGFQERLDPIHDILGEEFKSSSARTRAFFCLLAAQNPLYLDNGAKLNLGPQVVSKDSRKERHHIFPQAQLKEHFSRRAYNSLCNVCYLPALDNETIGKKLPHNYLAWYRDSGKIFFARVMKSHLIPASNGSGVWERGVVKAFKQFRKERLALICKAFEKEACGMKLFSKIS